MRLKAIIIGLAAALCCVAAHGQATEPQLPEKMIDFKAIQPDGKVLRLSDFVGKGKYVLVDFWASWCGPCREEIPNLRNIWYDFRGKNLDIVGVPCYDKPKNTLAAVEELKIPWKQILNVPDEIPEAYGFDHIPYIVLFAPDGTILERDLRGEDIREAVKKYVTNSQNN